MGGVLRALLTALPLLTLLVVFGLVFGVGAPRPLASARVWGGPSDRLSRFSCWVEVDADAGASRRVHLRARDVHGAEATADAELDADGRAELALEFPAPPGAFELELSLGERQLGHGTIALTHERWLEARRRGGFSPLRAPGTLDVAVAPLRGAFAVPFAGTLLVRVERAAAPLPGVSLALSSDGATLAPERATTNGAGLARVSLTPREHIVTLRASLTGPDGARAELFTTVPVVPGAMVAERRGDELVIAAPSSRTSADVSIVSEAGRLFGARVALRPDAEVARGVMALPALGPERIWAVVSSDAAAPSPATIGWPLFEQQGPSETFDAADNLLLDTLPQVSSEEHQRRQRVRRWALLIGLLGAVVNVAAFVGAAMVQRREGREVLSRELDDALAASILPRQRARSLLAIALIIIGFFVVVGLLAWRLR